MLEGKDEKIKFPNRETVEVALHCIAKESARQKRNPDARCFCPRCGAPMDSIHRHALSRRADIIVCDACGVQESLEDVIAAGMMSGEILPIEKWAVVKGE